MKKLTLRIDTLRVETFAASKDTTANAGTVAAHEATPLCSAGCTTGQEITCYNTCEWEFTCHLQC